MKYLIGTLITFIILAIASYFVLQIWEINLMSKEHFNQSMFTLGIILFLSIVLNIVVPFFFKNHAKGYDPNSGNVAQSKKK
ncbi:MAG: hypothetical protein ABI554_05965 [Flavobacterium sp.]